MRNRELEALVAERTHDLKVANDELDAHRGRLESEVQQRTAALSIAKEAAESANRAKSIFLATVSHELRTPMNAIMGMTSLAQTQASDPSLIHRLSVIDQAANHLLAVINDILDISNLESERLTLDIKTFKLCDSLDRISQSLRNKAAGKGLQLEIEEMAEAKDLLLRGDPVRLEQILLNLVDNAVKFTEQGDHYFERPVHRARAKQHPALL